jgi:phosphoribosylformimino-5-aminoimidazole carboxamide ribotide isomerase
VKLYPAIDMLGGKAVRLIKGDFEAKKVYDEDPLSAAGGWVADGARFLHVVDLDGARAGTPENLVHLRRIVDELDIPVQFGGGLRTLKAIEAAMHAGAQRVILGTAAFSDSLLLERSLELWPGRVLVSVDVRDGRIATEGWTETVDGGLQDVIAQLARRGAHELVYTNVDRDGMLEGPDLAEVADVVRTAHASLTYSGGIGALTDLEGLAALPAPGLDGVIVGKALYERRFTVAEALTVLDAPTA